MEVKIYAVSYEMGDCSMEFIADREIPDTGSWPQKLPHMQAVADEINASGAADGRQLAFWSREDAIQKGHGVMVAIESFWPRQVVLLLGDEISRKFGH